MTEVILRISVLFCLVGGIVLASEGCAPSPQTQPSGHADLRYSNSTASGLIFVLENGLSGSIRFRGYKASPADITPDVYSMLCSSEATGIATAIGAGFKDGGARPDLIKAMAGERMQLAIPAEYFQPYKGQRCKLSLILENGLEVTSQEFVP